MLRAIAAMDDIHSYMFGFKSKNERNKSFTEATWALMVLTSAEIGLPREVVYNEICKRLVQPREIKTFFFGIHEPTKVKNENFKNKNFENENFKNKNFKNENFKNKNFKNYKYQNFKTKNKNYK